MNSKRKSGPIKTQPGVKGSGIFITFEGIEGCGKTTQCHRMKSLLQSQGYWVVGTREPGGTPFAERIRKILLHRSASLSFHDLPTSECEAALIFACRAQHVNHVITPALSKGAVLLCDRYSDSTLAYQGYGRGLHLETLQHFNTFSTNNLKPDLTFLFDLPVRQGLARREKARNQNRLDHESLRFHERVRKGFLALAKSDPKRITVIDGRKSLESISSEVSTKIAKLIDRKHLLPLYKKLPNPQKKARYAV